MTTVDGFDCSSWQDVNETPQMIDWDKAATNTAKFTFIRASFGTAPDEDFGYNWRESKRTGFLRGLYQFIDYRKPARPQAELLYSLVRDDLPELPHVLDLEKLWLPQPAGANMLAWVREWFDVADALFGRPGIFYTNPATIRYWLINIPDWLKAHPLWVAHYGVSAPSFAPWNTWTFWQYSSVGPGPKFGMESKGLDLDYFNGDEAALLTFAGKAPSPAPELTLEQKVNCLWQKLGGQC